MMMANAILDIPPIRRINKLENALSMRESTRKVIMLSGGLTVLSRYLQYSQRSCHDMCKYGMNVSLGTESKIPRSPMRRVVTPKREAGPCRNLEKISEGNLVDRRKKIGISVEVSPYIIIQDTDDHIATKMALTQEGCHGEDIKEDLTDTKNSSVSVRPSTNAKPWKPEYPAINLEPSSEDPFDNQAMVVEGEAKDENAETKSPEGEKCVQVSVKPSPDSESKKLANAGCIERGESCWTDKEFILPEQVLLSHKETDCAVGHAKDSKLMHPSSLVRQMCPNGKQKSKGPKSKEENMMSMTLTDISGGRNKGEMTTCKGIRSSAIANKKSVVPPSVSSMNTQKKKLSVVYHLKKQDKLQGMDAKRPDNVKGVSRFLDSKNVKRLNSEQAKSVNIPETNPENKPVEPDQNNVVSIRPSSSSKDNSIKQIQNKIPISRPPRAYEKKKMIYMAKGMQGQASGFAPSLSSFLGMKSLTSTPNGSVIAQPSLTSVSSLASLQSFHNDTSTEHAKAAAEKKKCSSKMLYKVKPKRALSFCNTEPFDNQKGKFNDCTPRRIKFKQRVNANNINDDNQNNRVEEFKPKRLKFSPRVNADDTNGANHNSKVKEFKPKRLKFKQILIAENRNGDNHNSKVEEFNRRRLKFSPRVNAGDTNGANHNSRVKEFKPKRLKFRQRLIAENRNGDSHNSKVDEFNPRRLEFRRKVIADNKNDDNQNSGIEELSPRTLEFRQEIIVEHMNVDNQNCGVDEFTLTRPELSQRALDNRNADHHNGTGEDSTPRKPIFRQKGFDETKTGSIQSPKASTSKNNSGGREVDAGCDIDKKIQSEKFSLRHRGVNEKKGLGSLYNNIIEQTASRLAETKASKVKALVSAFETVISHLDTRISETNDGN